MSDNAAFLKAVESSATRRKQHEATSFKQDLKFCAFLFVVIIWLLFHYALIMRDLLRHPYMGYTRMAVHAAVFLANTVLTFYVVFGYWYPYVCGDQQKAKLD